MSVRSCRILVIGSEEYVGRASARECTRYRQDAVIEVETLLSQAESAGQTSPLSTFLRLQRYINPDSRIVPGDLPASS